MNHLMKSKLNHQNGQNYRHLKNIQDFSIANETRLPCWNLKSILSDISFSIDISIFSFDISIVLSFCQEIAMVASKEKKTLFFIHNFSASKQ